MAASAVHILFRVVYATLYTLLHIILVALLLITPADLINQARTRHNVYPILIVSAVYVGGILIVVFVYFVRLYITRSVLNSIPKAWIPVGAGDVRPAVRRLIVAGLSRSAAVAYVSRPTAAEGAAGEMEVDDALGIKVPAAWSAIEHGGWSPPGKGDAENDDDDDIPPLLPYSTVVAELPSLVEATALMLAPRDATTGGGAPSDPPRPDPDALDLLQRPAPIGLRDYLAHLVTLGVLDLRDGPAPGDNNTDDTDARPLGVVVRAFAASYEAARFSTRPLSRAAFRQLMADLATILRRMRPLRGGYENVEEDDGDSNDDYEESVEDDEDASEMLSDGHYDGDDDVDNKQAPPPSASTTVPHNNNRARAMMARHRLRVPPSRARTTQRSSASPSANSARHSSSAMRSSSSSSAMRSSSSSSGSSSAHTVQHQHQHQQQPPLPISSSSSSSNSSSSAHSVQRGSAASIRSEASGGTSGSSGSVIWLAERGEGRLPYVLLPGERA